MQCYTCNMKTTQYFQATRLRPDRSMIKDDWITFVIQNPERILVQSDGRIKNGPKLMKLTNILE